MEECTPTSLTLEAAEEPVERKLLLDQADYEEHPYRSPSAQTDDEEIHAIGYDALQNTLNIVSWNRSSLRYALPSS